MRSGNNAAAALFFIHGSSVFALETEAVKKNRRDVKRCENMLFRGIVKYFSIKMPHFFGYGRFGKFPCAA